MYLRQGSPEENYCASVFKQFNKACIVEQCLYLIYNICIWYTMFIFNIQYKFYLIKVTISKKINKNCSPKKVPKVLLWLVHKFSYPIYFFNLAYHAIEKKSVKLLTNVSTDMDTQQSSQDSALIILMKSLSTKLFRLSN